MNTGDKVKIKEGDGGIYFDGGDKVYTIQDRDQKQDEFFDMLPSFNKEDYVYLIPDKIPLNDGINYRTRFINKKYLTV